MLHNLFPFQQTKELLTNLAAGDLTEDGIGEKKKMGPLDLLVLKTVRGLRPLIRVVGNSASRLHKKMEELEARSDIVTDHVASMNATMRDMAEAINDSVERTQQVAVEMSDISKLLLQIKGTHQDLSRSSVQLTGLVGEGQVEMTDALERISEYIQQAERSIEGIEHASVQVTGAMQNISAMVEQAAAGIEEILVSAETQHTTIEGMRTLIKEVLRSGLSLRSAVSQFKLPSEAAGGSGGKFRQFAHDWIESALQVRVMMIKVFDISDKSKLNGWYQELCHQDDWMIGSFARLGDVMMDPEDRSSFDYLNQCWDGYLAARNKNVKLLFEGEFARAKDGVMNEARERFKQALDHMYEWLEDSYKDSESKLA